MIMVCTLSSDSIREKMKKNYLSNPSYNYDQVNRASLACGPMVKWAIAQVRNSEKYTNEDYNWLKEMLLLLHVPCCFLSLITLTC